MKIEIDQIYNMCCLKGMDLMIEQDFKVDAIITDPPYGTTACKWDSVIPFEDMWQRLKLLRKDRTPIVLFGSEPFSSALRMSNIKEYKYDWIWDKKRGFNFASVKYQPFKSHEIISIFYKNNYNPQMTKGKPYMQKQGYKGEVYGGDNKKEIVTINHGERYPLSIQQFIRENGKHPTQKPVALIEYLIKTYTNENDLVLDFTIGSGTLAIAAINTNRRYIGFELNKKYYNIATDRINKHLLDI